MNEYMKFIATYWENIGDFGGVWCYYCGWYQMPGNPEAHEENCLHLKAIAAINANKIMED